MAEPGVDGRTVTTPSSESRWKFYSIVSSVENGSSAGAIGSSYVSTFNDDDDADGNATATMMSKAVKEHSHRPIPPSSLHDEEDDEGCHQRRKRKLESSPSSFGVLDIMTTDQRGTNTIGGDEEKEEDMNCYRDERNSNAVQQCTNAGQKKRTRPRQEEEEDNDNDNDEGDEDKNSHNKKRCDREIERDSVSHDDDDDDDDDQQDSMIRDEIRSSLAGAALVFRFGKPSTKPVSLYEKETLVAALQNEDDNDNNTIHNDDQDDEEEGDNNATTLNNSKSYFESIGVHLKEEIIDEKLEEEVIERIIDILLEQRNSRSVRNRGRLSLTSSTASSSAATAVSTAILQSQPFTCPDAVANRELYFVTTKSCKRMKQAMGRPFEPLNKSHFAFYVQNMDIAREGVGVDGDTSANALLTRSSAICRSGNGILPDVEGSVDDDGIPNHTQNLNNPRNHAFMEVLRSVQETFGKKILWTGNENKDGKKENHRFKCLQLILAERDRHRHYAVGERGLHQDKWSTAGAAIIGVTIGPGKRQLTMQHRSLQATYDLKCRSAYIISGAARYGTLWKKRGLKSPIKHGLSRFTTSSSTTTTNATSEFNSIVDERTEEYDAFTNQSKPNKMAKIIRAVRHLPHLKDKDDTFIEDLIDQRMKTFIIQRKRQKSR